MYYGEDKEEDRSGTPAIVVLPAAHGLAECVDLFSREKADLDALMLLAEEDLKTMGVPLSPRKNTQGDRAETSSLQGSRRSRRLEAVEYKIFLAWRTRQTEGHLLKTCPFLFLFFSSFCVVCLCLSDVGVPAFESGYSFCEFDNHSQANKNSFFALSLSLLYTE